MTAVPIQPVTAVAASEAIRPLPVAVAVVPPSGPTSFAQLMINGVDGVNQKVLKADSLAAAFAVDDSIPPHQVTFALEQARLSLELMMQVRSRLVEAYQEFSRMQL